MLTTRWQPYSDLLNEFEQLRNRMDQFLRPFAETGWVDRPFAYPPLNIWQDEENVYAEAELPGMQLDDLEIYVTGGNQLSIRGERKPPQIAEKGVWHRQERGFGKFARTVTLPVSVDADKIEAKFCHGVLTITMPKSAASKPRKITVRAD